jgi:opacity protein-like surface antigen
MRTRALAAFIILFLAFGAATASAQTGLYVGGYLGYSAQKPSVTDVTFTTDTSLVWGLRAGLRFLMLALEVNYFSAMHNIAMSDFLLLNWDGRTNDYSYIGLNLKYLMSIAFIHPYLTAGYGYYTVDIKDIDKDKEGGYNFGAGVEVQLGKRFGLVVEGKYHHVRVDIAKVDLALGNFILTGGLNLHF